MIQQTALCNQSNVRKLWCKLIMIGFMDNKMFPAAEIIAYEGYNTAQYYMGLPISKGKVACPINSSVRAIINTVGSGGS